MRRLWILLPILCLTLAVVACGEGEREGSAGEKPVKETAGSSRMPPAKEASAPAAGAPGPKAESLQSRLHRVHESSKASVVNVTTRKVVANLFSLPVPRKGTSSGFVYDREGHIVTSYHNVRNAENISVAFSEDEMYPAKVVGQDPSTDLAVLKTEAGEIPDPLPMGNSDDLRPGAFAVALGNPFGLERTLTFGVVSAVGRVIRSPNGMFISEAIQTDVPTNPGNSGGPLLDLEGRVIGLNAMIVSPSGASSGVGFAISANTLKKVCPALIEKGSYPHPWIGVQGVNLNKTWVNILRGAGMEVPVDSGFLVLKTAEGSPAAEAGIRGGGEAIRIGAARLPVGGDILVELGGEPVDTYKDLMLYLESKTEIGETIEATLFRDGETMTVPVTVGRRPAEVRADEAGWQR